MAPSAFDAGTRDSNASFDYLDSDDADRDGTKLNVYAEVHVVEHAATRGGVTKALHEVGGPS